MVHDGARPGAGRVKAVEDWIGRRADTRRGRLAQKWFHAYFKASNNSGSAATLYMFLSVFPTALAGVAYFDSAGGDTNAFAERLVTHLKLTGSSASLVRDTFGAASNNALAATFAVIISFLLWGLGIGQIYQNVYARAWRIKVGSPADQGRFAIWYFVFTGAVGVAVVSLEQLRAAGWLLLLPVWILGSTVFWLWTPRFLLHRKIGLRALLPGALLASVCIGGAFATSPFWFGAWVNSYGKYFGSAGVIVAMIAYTFILVTISMVCAVFSPVWSEWRQTERERPLEPAALS